MERSGTGDRDSGASPLVPDYVILKIKYVHAGVAKLVDALVLGTSGVIRGGSSPLSGTNTSEARIFVGEESKLLCFREDLNSGICCER